MNPRETRVSKTVILISFVTKPGSGSEGGVGWKFFQAAYTHVAETAGHLHCIIDKRDSGGITKALEQFDPKLVTVHFASHGAFGQFIFGNSRTRASYLFWLLPARKLLKTILRTEIVEIVHQVTFATVTMPPVFQSERGNRQILSIFGPAGVPIGKIDSSRGLPNLADFLSRRVAYFLAKRNIRKIDRFISINELSAEFFGGVRGKIFLEPNVVCEPHKSEVSRDDKLLVLVGQLINRKRPWLAIEAMRHESLQSFHLKVIGGGPLLPNLQKLTQELDLAHRVEFIGSVPREETLTLMASAKVLLHPSSREGSPWVVGEAAAMGVPAVVFAGSGADTVAILSSNGSVVLDKNAGSPEIAVAARRIAVRRSPNPSSRWSEARLPNLLEQWWREFH